MLTTISNNDTKKVPITCISKEHIEEEFRKEGALLISGFDLSENRFREFTDSICTGFVSHYNSSREFIGDSTLMTVSPGNNHFLAHSELAYSPSRPDLAIFYAVEPPVVGGETTYCDGIEVLDRLQPETREIFLEQDLLFESKIRFDTSYEAECEKRRNLKKYAKFGPKYQCSSLGSSLHTRYQTSAICSARWSKGRAFSTSLLDTAKPQFANGDLVPKEVLWDVISVTEELMVGHIWKENDVLLIDNYRYMHGRKPWDGNRRVLARFGNIDF